MEITVRSKYLPLILSLHSAELPPGISVAVPPVMARRDLPEAWATAIFTVVFGIPASVIAGMLIEKFKNDKSAVITINRKEVALENGEIVRVIEESIKMERK
jgi:hypothetical protein